MFQVIAETEAKAVMGCLHPSQGALQLMVVAVVVVGQVVVAVVQVVQAVEGTVRPPGQDQLELPTQVAAAVVAAMGTLRAVGVVPALL